MSLSVKIDQMDIECSRPSLHTNSQTIKSLASDRIYVITLVTGLRKSFSHFSSFRILTYSKTTTWSEEKWSY